MIIRDGGIGAYVESDKYFDFSAKDQENKNKLDYAINKIITQFANYLSLKEVEIDEGATLIAFDGRRIDFHAADENYRIYNEENSKRSKKYLSLHDNDRLAEYEFGKYYGDLKITGNGSIFKFINYGLKVDENVKDIKFFKTGKASLITADGQLSQIQNILQMTTYLQ